MSAAAYNRGSRLLSREADERMPTALSRADRQAHNDEVSRLREQVAALGRDLRRARRCLASERAGREALRVRLANEERANALAWVSCAGSRFRGTNREFVQSNECEAIDTVCGLDHELKSTGGAVPSNALDALRGWEARVRAEERERCAAVIQEARYRLANNNDADFPADAHDAMGSTVYCDGSCRKARRAA